jgi:hypothetical protein
MSAPTTLVIDRPGVYDGIPDDAYHADPVPGGSLSASGAKKLLAPSCPALFRYDADHGAKHKREFNFGHAAHKKVLGVGAEIVPIDAANYKTKAAQEARDAAYAAGKVPLLPAEVAVVDAMAAALIAHPWASLLFNPEAGKPEQSIFWFDEEFGIWRRARLDWLPNPTSNGRLICIDYKSAVSAEPGAFSRTVANFGYHMQDAFYLDAVQAVGLGDEDTAFLFVVQEKTPPYLVTVVELDARAIQVGRERNRRALEIFRDCQQSGIWPGYSNEIELISLPNWALRQHEEY